MTDISQLAESVECAECENVEIDRNVPSSAEFGDSWTETSYCSHCGERTEHRHEYVKKV